MTNAESPFLNYPIGARSFLNRAVEALARFDATLDASDFFAAALQLRFGIEARLFEYIKASLGGSKPEGASIK